MRVDWTGWTDSLYKYKALRYLGNEALKTMKEKNKR